MKKTTLGRRHTGTTTYFVRVVSQLGFEFVFGLEKHAAHHSRNDTRETLHRGGVHCSASDNIKDAAVLQYNFAVSSPAIFPKLKFASFLFLVVLEKSRMDVHRSPLPPLLSLVSQVAQ